MANPVNDTYTASVGTTIYGGVFAPTPPSLTLTAPSPASGVVGTASANFTVTLNNGTGSVTITPASSPGSTLTPTSLTVSPGSPTNYFTLNALTAAVHTVSISNSAGITNPSSVIYTAAPAPATATQLTLSVASTGTTGTPVTVTVTPNLAIGTTGTATLAASNSGVLGTTTLNFSAGSSAAQTTTLNRTTDGSSVITMTNSMGLTNVGSGATYTSSTAVAQQAAGAGVASFSLVSSAGVTTQPFTVGMAMVEGAFPSNNVVVSGSGITSGQVVVRTSWPDGSAKFALVSGKATIPASGTISGVLQRGTSSGTALTESDLTTALAGSGACTLQFAGGTVISLPSLIGVAAIANSSGTISGGRVRQLISGPTMSAWLYCAPLGGNAHLVGWFEVRLYAGGSVHILPWIENGWTRVGSCAGQIGTLTFTMGGTTRYSQTGVHIANHCRVVAQSMGVGHWLGTAPDIYAAPDPIYMQNTGLVPPYYQRDTSGATTQLNALAQAYSPTLYGQLATSPRNGAGNGTDHGNFDTGMADSGYHAGIGPLPEWDVFYLTSKADKRAYNAVIANAMGYGRYGVHFRDENTLVPFNPSDGVNKTLYQGGNYNIAEVGGNQFAPAEVLPNPATVDNGSGTQINSEYWAYSHHPSAGYMAHLLTGHEFFLELCQFTAGTCFLRQNNIWRNYGEGLLRVYGDGQGEQKRGVAWSLRTLFQAVTISVDGSAIKTGLQTIATNNIAHYLASYVTSPCGSFGATRPYSNFNTNSAVAQYRVNAWELDFSVCAWGYGLKMKPVSGSALTDMKNFFNWHAQWVVHRVGALGDATQYGFNAAGRQNSVCIAPSFSSSPWNSNAGPWYSNPGAVFQDTIGTSNASNVTNTIGAADSNNGFFPDATSYWGNLQTALAYAVEHGVAGAWDGYLRMINASNWASFDTSAATQPVGTLRSKLSPYTWAASLSSDAFVSVGSQSFTTYMTAALPGGGSGGYRGSDPIQSPIDAFCDPATSVTNGAQYAYGGGHGDGTNNSVSKFDFSTLTWTMVGQPTPPSIYLPSYNRDVSHPSWADPVAYPSGVKMQAAVGGHTVFDNNSNEWGWFRRLQDGLVSGVDDAYAATDLARASTHMYGAAAMRGDVIHYFYLQYGEFNTVTGKWSGFATSGSIGGQLKTLQTDLTDVGLQQGTFAVYDDITDRFFVTLQPGDSGPASRSGLFVFRPSDRTVENIYNYGTGFVNPSSPLLKVNRTVWLFRKVPQTTYTSPQYFNQGIIFDMDDRSTKYFTIQGNPVGTTIIGGASVESIPCAFDGTRIVRWNYEAAARSNVHIIDPNAPISGTGTSGDPLVFAQTARAITGYPTDITLAYSRFVYLPQIKAFAFIPRASSTYRALKLS